MTVGEFKQWLLEHNIPDEMKLAIFANNEGFSDNLELEEWLNEHLTLQNV